MKRSTTSVEVKDVARVVLGLSSSPAHNLQGFFTFFFTVAVISDSFLRSLEELGYECRVDLLCLQSGSGSNRHTVQRGPVGTSKIVVTNLLLKQIFK